MNHRLSGRKDKIRVDWLQENMHAFYVLSHSMSHPKRLTLRQAIDAEMKPPTHRGGER